VTSRVRWANPPVPQGRLRPNTLDPTLFRQLLELGCGGLGPLPVSPSSEDLDKQAEVLVQIIQDAYCGAAKRALGAGHGNPWWNNSCREARKGYKIALRSSSNDSSVYDAQKAYRKTVQIAKNNFFKTKLERARTAKEIFGITKWHKSAGTYRSRPLKDSRFPEQPPVQSLAGKMEVLMQNLLANPSVVGDIPMDSPTVSSNSPPFPSSTDEEIRDSILRAGNTAPGADGIPTAIIRRTWLLIEQQVLSLFNACLSIGHHPECFRKAILMMIQKPNKIDNSSPRSYRPIALLSVLGKGLERFIAKRMAWTAIRHKVVSSQQFGALPGRSAVDLTTCLTQDAEKALYEGSTASMLTLDVKGAFDAVYPGRLVHRLREQGWPENLVRWV
ncbi:BgTH12-01053, partial [Blumeria graminis f. sp. triticale]